MKTQNALCPSDAALSDFGLGKLDAASAETVSQHLETCDGCRQRVASLPADSFVDRLRDVGDNSKAGRTPPKPQRMFVPGESIGGVSTSDTSQSGTPRTSPAVAIEKAPSELANHPDYELMRQLGQGGMGTVYLARHRITHRLEVLKVVSKSLLAHPGAMERFQHEIRSACSLAHPNVVAAYGVLHLGDLLIFVMEYVKGHDLSQVVKRRGPLPVANAAFYGHQAALGLQHAHEKGMVHRDIKPNNLMLAVEGKKHIVKILDFGLAKSTNEKAADHGLTKSGQMLGTPDYVAPEQTLKANKADIRSDIYSLGCTLYFLLSGGPPFQEESLYEVLQAHHTRDPRPLNLVRPEVPVELATVVAKMMAKDPARRFQTPVEVARALVPFFNPGPPAATGASQPAAETAHGLRSVTPASPIAPPPVQIPMPVVATVPQAAPTPTATEPFEDFSVSIDTERHVLAPRRGSWASLPPWQRMTAVLAACAAAVVLFGAVFLVRTPSGIVKIEFRPPNAKVTLTIDGDQIDIDAIDQPLSLKVGKHKFTVTGAGFETKTKQFTVTRGENEKLTITLVRRNRADPQAPPPAIAPFSAEQAKKHQRAWADYLRVPVEHTNSIGMKLVLIPPGEFMMGSMPAEVEETLKQVDPNDKHWQECIRSEAPQHKVVLTQPIYLGVHEVTQKEYHAVMGKNPSWFAKTGPDAQAAARVTGLDTENLPVGFVSWNDAAEFCAKLSQQENLKPFHLRAGETVASSKGTGYRLPTEAEWEYACRAGTTSEYWVGDGEQQLAAAGWYGANSGGRMHEVEELPSNPLGLFGVHGNAWEWVEDGWDTTYYARFSEKPAIDPSCPFSADSRRVLRGGDWGNSAFLCRSAIRNAGEPTWRDLSLGLRVVLPVAGVKIALSKQPENAHAGWQGWPADGAAATNSSPNQELKKSSRTQEGEEMHLLEQLNLKQPGTVGEWRTVSCLCRKETGWR